MNPVEQRSVIKHLRKKSLTATKIHQKIVATIKEGSIFYDIVKRSCQDFKCKRTSCKIQHAVDPPVMETINQNIKKRMSNTLVTKPTYAHQTNL